MSILEKIPLKSERAMRTGAGPVVLMTRIRLARNLRDYYFPDWAKPSMRAQVLSTCRNAVMAASVMKNGVSLEVASLDELDRGILVERHLISRELANAKEGAAVCISKDQGCSVMINEEDHLRVQILRPGLQFKQAWRVAGQLDKTLEKQLDFAFSKDIGYLTACPSNVGTGLRGSALIHLPGLVLSGEMEKVVRAVGQLGMTVRGLFGEGSEAHGSMFQISNQQTLGESETEILRHIEAVLRTILEQEENARARLIEQAPETLFDKIGRCYGTLRYGHVLTSSEALNFLSLVRLAVDLNILPETKRGLIDRLVLEVQPGHLQGLFGDTNMLPQARDRLRAKHIRQCFSQMPEPDFGKARL